jgi:polysaccharide export outer membrane protein/exopolysaccharide production protein ExoF
MRSVSDRVAGTRAARRTGVMASACASLALLLGLLPAASDAAAEDYRLGPQDRLRLKIFEWRASRDEFFEWTALNDEFTVGPDGALSLPFAGSVRADGLTVEALGDLIAERLVQNVDLGVAPDVSVEIVAFRPFYIVGHVSSPGEYPFRPGLTVLQAVSVAGGLREREDETSRFEREEIAGRGELDLLALSKLGLVIRRARLRAELDGAAEVTFPPDLEAGSRGAIAAALMSQERAVFDARRQGVAAQRRALDELRDFLGRETEALHRQLAFIDRQIELATEELVSVTSLVDQGLAVAPRQRALERSLLDSRSDRLSVETALLRTRQEMSRTDIRIVELNEARAEAIAGELRETELRLDETAQRAETALRLLRDSEAAGATSTALRRENARAVPVYTIVRRGSGGVSEELATETTFVAPGDTITVELPLAILPSDVDEAAALAP